VIRILCARDVRCVPDRIIFDSRRDFGSGVDIDKLPCTINTALGTRVDFGVEKTSATLSKHSSNLTTRLFQLSRFKLCVFNAPRRYIVNTRDHRAGVGGVC
jgi:hypothetical protein